MNQLETQAFAMRAGTALNLFVQDPNETPRVPRWLRGHAEALPQHYPFYDVIEKSHKALPDLFGTVPPFSRMSGTADVQAVIDAPKEKP